MALADFDTLHNVSVGKHFYQFYRNDDDYVKNVASFFRCGFAKNQACLWLVSERIGVSDACKHIAEQLPNFKDLLATGQLTIFSAESWYLKDGRFCKRQAISNALTYLKWTLESNYSALRGCGDSGAIPHEDWSEVFDYEVKMHEWIKAHPVIALCTYPITRCNLSDTRKVVTCHDAVLVGSFS